MQIDQGCGVLRVVNGTAALACSINLTTMPMVLFCGHAPTYLDNQLTDLSQNAGAASQSVRGPLHMRRDCSSNRIVYVSLHGC